jgi:hypothetical protein
MQPYALYADLILIAHASFIAFVVLGQALIVAGRIARWRWVRNFWFRAAHIAAIFYVVSEAWLGIACPLTEWEQALRRKAGQGFYSGGFIVHWLHKIIFFDFADSTFTAIYSLFGLLVALSLYYCPPRLPFKSPPWRSKA